MGIHGKLVRPFLRRQELRKHSGNNAVEYVKSRRLTWAITHSFINHYNMGTRMTRQCHPQHESIINTHDALTSAPSVRLQRR